MSKRIHQYNLQHSDKPTKELTFKPPSPRDAGIKNSSLVSKQANIEHHDDQVDEDSIDEGDLELSNMIASIQDMDDNFIYTGYAKMVDKDYCTGSIKKSINNDEQLHHFMDDKNFITAQEHSGQN